MGITADVVGLEPYGLQQLYDPGLPLSARIEIVDIHGLADDLAHSHAGVKGGIGVLKDHLDMLAVFLGLFALESGDVLPLVADRA